jgi:hypothetical protein
MIAERRAESFAAPEDSAGAFMLEIVSEAQALAAHSFAPRQRKACREHYKEQDHG